jgi:hypothetical protein
LLANKKAMNKKAMNKKAMNKKAICFFILFGYGKD